MNNYTINSLKNMQLKIYPVRVVLKPTFAALILN